MNATGSELGIVMFVYLLRAFWLDTSDNAHRSRQAITVQRRRFGNAHRSRQAITVQRRRFGNAVAHTQPSARSFGRWVPSVRSPFALLAAASWLAALADFSRSWPPSALDVLLALAIALCFSLASVAFQGLYKSCSGDTELTPWQFCGFLSVACLIDFAVVAVAR